MSTVYLFCVFVAVVAANPLFQRLPIQFSQTCPSQACPVCPSQTCPNQVLPPCQACQNNGLRNVFASMPVVNQPSNNCPCNQPANTQNQVTNPPVDPEILKQVMISRFLSPQFQMLMNPNPNRVCNQCDAQNNGVPNIINNYIIIPPEYFKTNKTDDYKDNNKRRYRGRRGRKQQRQMVQNEDQSSMEYVSDNGDMLREFNENESGRWQNNRPRKRGRPSKQENISEYSNETEESECDLSNENNNSNIVDDSLTLKQLPERADENRKSMRQVLVEHIRKLIKEKPEVAPTPGPVAESYSNGNLVPRKINPTRVKNVEDAIIKDFCTKNPTIPEEIAKTLLETLKLQAQISDSSKLQQNSFFPIGYGQHFPQMFSPAHQTMTPKIRTTQSPRQPSEKRPRPTTNRPERQNKDKKEERRDTREECDNCVKVVELNPSLVNIETETITKEKIKATGHQVNNVASKKISEQQIETPKDLVGKVEAMKDKFTKINEIETTTVKYNKFETFPELGKEDKILTIYENGVGDYYPNFRDIAYYSSDEEPDRYHYTTDRNGGKRNEQRYVNLKKHNSNDIKSELNDNRNVGKTNSEYTLPIPTEINEEYPKERLSDKSVEITFRSPPFLESPDFQTKQIKYASQEINDIFVADNFDKTSVHSDAKSDSRIPENDLTPVKVFSKDKKGRTSIETVFGHSKVAKYGQDAEGASSTPVITYYLPEEAMTEERIQLPDGDYSVVVAKSIRNLEEIWD